MPTSKPLRQWLAAISGLRQIVIDPAADWKEPTRRAETIIRSDPARLAEGLAERLNAGAEARGVAWADDWRSADHSVGEAVGAELEAIPEASEPGIWPALAEHLRDGDQVLAASSMPIRDQEAFLPPGRADVRFLANRGANGIDGLISTAAGASAAAGKRTWAVIGDLALAHDLNGLAAMRTAPELRLLVLDNAGGGIFHFLPQAEAMPEPEFEALLGTPSGLDPAKAAALFGLESATVEAPAELERALAGDARMIVVKLDRRSNLELHRRLADVATSALAQS
jgi:2-succinyl-5-enolpyruvyl-6-hydroxy-3-cyclohexene-1-carboxylate synthase